MRPVAPRIGPLAAAAVLLGALAAQAQDSGQDSGQDAAPESGSDATAQCNPVVCPPPSVGVACCLAPQGPCGIDVGTGCSAPCVPAFCPVGAGEPCCVGLAGPCGFVGPAGCEGIGGSGGSGGGPPCLTPQDCPIVPEGPPCCSPATGTCGYEQMVLGVTECVTPCTPQACEAAGAIPPPGTTLCCAGPNGPCGFEEPGLPECFPLPGTGGTGGSGGTGGGPATDAGSLPDGGFCSASVAACKDAAPGSLCAGMPDCSCTNCLPQIDACERDLGCRAVVECAIATQCSDQFCSPCTNVVMQWGGPGNPSVQKAVATRSCILQHDCGLGSTCETNADCAAGLTCLSAGSGAINGGGPPRGLCTMPCSAEGGECTGTGLFAYCANFGTPEDEVRYCVQRCAFGGQQLDPNKCRGRLDVACTPVRETPTGPVIPLCGPRCTSDDACGADLYCNPRTGMCQLTKPVGEKLGAQCPEQPDGGDGSTNPCLGNCVGLTDSPQPPYVNFTNLCAEFCITGALGCGWTGPGSSTGYCIFGLTDILQSGEQGFGDLGGCAELCNCDAECANPDISCVPSPNPQLAAAIGKAGVCSGNKKVQSNLVNECKDAASGASDAGEDANLGACVYGQTKACHADSGCLGAQQCLEDRTGYGPCTCSDAASGAGGAAGSDAGAGAAGGSSGGSAGSSGSGSGGTPSDASIEDAGAAGPASGDDAGCGCRTPASGRATPLGMLLVGLLSVATRTLRRRRRSS